MRVASAGPIAATLVAAGLPKLRRVDADEADVLAADAQAVAVDRARVRLHGHADFAVALADFDVAVVDADAAADIIVGQ